MDKNLHDTIFAVVLIGIAVCLTICLIIPDAGVLCRWIHNALFGLFGWAGDTVFAGHSRIIDPWGETIASAESEETIITADCDESILDGIRRSINVFADRREDIYDIKK